MMQTYATHLLNGRRFLRGLLAAALVMVVGSTAWAQDESLVVSGTLKHEETKQRLIQRDRVGSSVRRALR